MSFDWNHARTFLSVAEEGSLSAAARKLDQTQPTISRQIAALEAALGIILFERTGRSVHLTGAGMELLEHIRAMSQGADRVALAASGRAQAIEGQVRITASDMMSAYILPPVVQALSRKAPELDIDIIADNTQRDLMRREADIAIRHARPEQPDLVAKRLGDQIMRFYASRDYLAAHGVPEMEDLSGHQLLSFVGPERMLGYLVPTGLKITDDNLRLSSSSQLVAWEMARRGLGMMIMTESVAAHCPEMELVLESVQEFPIPVWLVAHRELRTSRRFRLVFDHLAEALA